MHKMKFEDVFCPLGREFLTPPSAGLHPSSLSRWQESRTENVCVTKSFAKFLLTPLVTLGLCFSFLFKLKSTKPELK